METYGLAHVWNQGDAVTRATALVLLLMSVASWSVIVIKSVRFIRLRRSLQADERAFWQAANLDEGIKKLGSDVDHPLRALVWAGSEAMSHYRQNTPHLHDQLNISDWVTRCLKNASDDHLARLQSGLAVLASIGSTAPFVGLFGTVWGIYHALLAIGVSGQTSIEQIAGPVGEALIMTASGLFVAIPAVLAYNTLVRGHRAIAIQLNRFAHSLHAYFVTGKQL